MPELRLVPRALVAMLGAAALGALPCGAQRLALLPPDDASGDREAAAIVEEALAGAAAERGWEVVRGEAVESALRALRLRRVDSVPSTARAELLDGLGASAVMVSSLHSFRPGRAGRVVLSSRLQDAEGRTSWSSFVALAAPETADPFDIRRAETPVELAAEAVERLCEALPSPGDAARRPRAARRPFYLRAPAAFRAAELPAGPARVGLVPFTNITTGRDASRILGELAARHLAASGGFEVIEPADFRAALLAEQIPSIRHLDPERLAAVGRRMDADLIVRGSVWRWVDAPAGVEGAIPEIELEVELIDVKSERVLAASHVARRGDDYSGWLGRHTVRGAAGLADRAMGEMVTALSKAEPTPAPSGTHPVAPAPGEDTEPAESPQPAEPAESSQPAERSIDRGAP